jgi:hypothetical protein
MKQRHYRHRGRRNRRGRNAVKLFYRFASRKVDQILAGFKAWHEARATVPLSAE